MASVSGTLYIGVTNDLKRRVLEHKLGIQEGFTKKYTCNRFKYFEEYSDVQEAIAREKKFKSWNRNKKEWLISQRNPEWVDFAKDI